MRVVTPPDPADPLYRSVVDLLPDAVFIAAADGRYVDANPAACDMFRMTRDEVLSRTLPDLLVPGERARIPATVAAYADGRIHRTEWQFLRRDGTTFVGELHGRQLEDGRLVGVVRDISERRQATEALRHSEQRYRTLFESIDQGCCIVEVRFDAGRAVDYRFLQVNAAFAKHTGLVDVIGRNASEVAPGLEEHWFESYGRVAHTRRPERFEHRAEPLGRDYDVYAFPIGAPDAKQVGILFSDVTARKRSEAALREADRRKNEFIAVLAHELRNPLAPLVTGVEILKLAPPGSSLAGQQLRTMQGQLAHVVHLLDDLLDVSRISRGVISLKPRAVDLATIVAEAVDTIRPEAERRRHRVSVRLAPLPMVHGDPARLRQVVVNLLSNAVKCTDPGGEIAVEVARDAASVVLRVVDNGPGIPADMQQAIFGMFEQLPAADGHREGLGIGLWLVRELVQLHGGTVEVRSEGAGTGSTFTVRLPLAAPAVPEPEPPARDAEGAVAARSLRILVVDDNRDAAESLATMLDLVGHTTSTAFGGHEVLPALDSFAADVVLLDIGMRDMDGYEVARRIRASGKRRGVLLVAVTGWGQDEDRRRAAEAGFDFHMVKPIDVAELQAILARASPRRPPAGT